MNNSHYCHGFSLIEVLASCVVLSLVALGITAAWRLADYKALLARLDHRAERILREYYELQSFAPASAKPFNSIPLPGCTPEDPPSGFLYHPLKVNSSRSSPQYDDLISYAVTYTPGDAPGTAQLTLLYTVPGYGSGSPTDFKKSVILNPLPAPTP
jgi:prepilin-type N-terminal cleavage/methylation domain-containing protein